VAPVNRRSTRIRDFFHNAGRKSQLFPLWDVTPTAQSSLMIEPPEIMAWFMVLIGGEYIASIEEFE